MRGLQDDDISALAAAAGYLGPDGRVGPRPETLPAGHRLYEPGAEAGHLLCVTAPRHAAGVLSVYAQLLFTATRGGKPLKSERIEEGQLFGEHEPLMAGFGAGLAPRRPPAREMAAVLLTPAVVLALPLAALAAVQDARLHARLARLGLKRMRDMLATETRARQIGGDVALADYLMRLADDYGTHAGAFTEFSVRLRQEDMANDLGISRRALTERLTDWAEAGLVRSAPLALLDIARIDQIRAVGSDSPAAVIAAAAARIDRALEAHGCIAAQHMALDLMRHYPAAPDLVWRAGLACVRSGRAEEAAGLLAAAGHAVTDAERLGRQVLLGLLRPQSPLPDDVPDRADLAEMAEDWTEDGVAEDGADVIARARALTGEILALAARIAKDRALDSGAPADFRSAAAAYGAIAGATGRPSPYASLNAATLTLAAGDAAAARAMAAPLARTAPDDYWSAATAMEAALITGDAATATARAGQAASLGASDGEIASTRRQLRVFARWLGPGAAACLDRLPARRPLVYSGTMIHDGQFEGATPAEVEAWIAAAARDALAGGGISAAFGPLAQGGDILIAEAVLEAGIDLHLVLPFALDAYVEASVTTDPARAADWRARFDAVVSQCRSLTVGHPGKPFTRDLSVSFRHGFRRAAAAAIRHAQATEAAPLLLAVRAAGAHGGLAGTTADVADWTALGHETRSLALPWRKRRASGPDRDRHGFAPALFLFPLPGHDALTLAAAAQGATATPCPTLPRKTRGGRSGAVLLPATLAEALTLARALQAQAGGTARVICDYGPVLTRDGAPGEELIAALPAAGDFADMPSDTVLATEGFTAELAFDPGQRVRARLLGQRLTAGGGARRRVQPSMGVSALDWP